jgi:hypothetical protein
VKIVFFTSEGFYSDEAFLYMFANVAACFRDVFILAVRRPRRPTKGSLKRRLKSVRRRWRLRGGAYILEAVSSYPLKRYIWARNYREAQANVRALPRPPVRPRPDAVVYVDTVNGLDAVKALRKLEPDVVIQHHAGILQSQIFEIARIGTLNLHPGITPLNRGPEPIYSALWAQEPEWMGATVHFIDEGIDTGPVQAYAPIHSYSRGESYPALFERIFALGVGRLVDVLCRLSRGERWTIDPPRGERGYRPSLSGWRLGFLQVRGALNRLLS